MSRKETSSTVTQDLTGYKQSTAESSSGSAKTGRTTKEISSNATERDLKNSSTTERVSAPKSHFAFDLAFTIAITDPYPFNPSDHC